MRLVMSPIKVIDEMANFKLYEDCVRMLGWNIHFLVIVRPKVAILSTMRLNIAKKCSLFRFSRKFGCLVV
ncbi:hypothetical protein RchiOBHm_Chr5g0020861 [Rosa chinensis]|uniref:Uncharacterized protein n=1 Tax=Rosa chinensis TaxID=74649 RepID=A0A2P6Q7C7_ROSCH|nr:hypothetical protein RchiOBHm_Chr5g0020861 [Rosa chinensis]